MLNFDPVTIVITIVNLVFLFFVLRALLFKPVSKFIAARSAKIQDDLDKAAKSREDARILLDSYQARIHKAEEDATAILQTARENAEKRAQHIVAEGKEQAASLVAAAKMQIEAERTAAYLGFKAEAARLVLAATGKLLSREISSQDARRLAEAALNECSVPDIRQGR
jgi:F-type H+-transporting ATPase subunit b